MENLKIFIICCFVAAIIVVLTFTIAFFVEITMGKKLRKEKPENSGDDEEEIDLDAMLKALEEKSQAMEEPVEETQVEEVVEEQTKEQQPEQEVEEVVEEPVVEEVPAEPTPIAEEEKEEAKEEVVVVNEGPVFDYNIRMEKIKESLAKVEKDLDKNKKFITKYERTQRRITRNKKLLNRKAGDLANLNLVMYKVNDIKDVDPEKKQKQEELVALITELKTSIADAEAYLAKNKDKYNQTVKMRDFLSAEQVRYNEEIKELEALIAAGETGEQE